MKILGLDIGTNSVGSAWVDDESQAMRLGVGVFPAGVEQKDGGRGAPKNQARRTARSQRRRSDRTARRKARLRDALLRWGWMPADEVARKEWVELNPWHLRRDGLRRALTPSEFGRVLLHFAQRRGPSWFEDEPPEGDADKAASKRKAEKRKAKKRTPKDANEGLCRAMAAAIPEPEQRTFGHYMANLFDQRTAETTNARPIRNRDDAKGDTVYEFCPDRLMLQDEFEKLWSRQLSSGEPIATELTPERKRELSNPSGTRIWRHQGLLWGQRNTYWDTGTLGRCDLEPTDQVCPKADMHAQEFLVLQEVNNIRLTFDGQRPRPLQPQERDRVIAALSRQKTGSAATVRAALGVNRKPVKNTVVLNIEEDKGRKLNTNWFVREIVGAIGSETWESLDPAKREAVNRAVCKFDPREPKDVENLAAGAADWFGLNGRQAEAFVEAWKTRPRPGQRVRLSRRAIRNLLPYLRRGLSVTEARQAFSGDPESGATPRQRERYGLAAGRPNYATRRFLSKHPDLPPPAPMLANPVVRKAIHEVRRHIIEHIRAAGCKPDRIVVELAREARLSRKVAERITEDNHSRRQRRQEIVDAYREIVDGLNPRQADRAIRRVLLCRAQNGICAYSNLDSQEARPITETQAARGDGLEIDHVIPRSRGGGNGLSNLVLCYAATNRGKGNRTPKEWLSPDAFAAMEQRFSRWKERAADREDRRRWQNLHKDAFTMEGYVQSALTDTAYAARQVTQWLQQAVFGPDGAAGAGRKVFCTNGRYTAMLRRLWGLHYDHGDETADRKTRADHRHHALDALVIACSGPERIGRIAAATQTQEIARGRGEHAPSLRIDTPWGAPQAFRAQAIDSVRELVVSHRPQGRKLVGALHKDTHYGPILDGDGEIGNEFTSRIPAARLKPAHLRVPENWEALREKLDESRTNTERRAVRRQMLALKDVKPGKSGLVRDRWFREELRGILRGCGLDPDGFTPQQLKQLIEADRFRLPSGVPIRRIRLRRIFNNAVTVRRRFYDVDERRWRFDPDARSTRAYDSQNNHHVEIREDAKGRWRGRLVTAFEAARRVRPPKASGRDRRPAVDRRDSGQGRFIMSLSFGETVRLAHPETGEPACFVVFKLASGAADGRPGQPTMHFVEHWDGGKSKADERFRERKAYPLSASQLRACALDGAPPRKVRVSPLGNLTLLTGD